MLGVIYRRRRTRQSVPGGYFQFENTASHSVLHGHGEGDLIRLRDQYGNVWRGQAERYSDNTVRYLFRDSDGRTISGMSDSYGVILRDEHGNVWRGFVDA